MGMGVFVTNDAPTIACLASYEPTYGLHGMVTAAVICHYC